MAVTYEFIDDGKSFVIKYKGQSYRAAKNDVELIIPNETNDNILKIRSNSAQLTDIEINLDEDTILGVGAGSTTATALDSALGAIFFLEEGGGSGGGQVNTVTAQSPLEDSGTVNKTIKLEDGSTDSSQLYWNGSAWVEIDLPYTVANDLVTFDRDVQIPQNSLNIGDAIKMSDLAQSIGYKTSFDNKQYILMGYEITDSDSKKPFIKDFSSPSSFTLQPLDNVTETFVNKLSVTITSVQQVIGKTYKIKAVCDQDILIQVFRVGEDTGVNTLIVNEEVQSSQTNINGFVFDLIPLVDFEGGKDYIIEFSPLNGGNLEVKGGLIANQFVPYIERTLGWEYTKKEVSLVDDIPKLYAHIGVTNNAPIENNTNVPVLFDTWDLVIPENGLYNVHVTVEYNINVVNRDAIFRFDVNGATGININQESKDLTNNIFFTTFAFDTLQAGTNTIEFYASIESPQNPSQRVEVKSNRYTAQKIDEVS